MTERTIRMMAKEMAGVFYEGNRSPAFRRAFPTLQSYMRGQWHQSDGDVVINKPGWMYHIDLVRKLMGSMLSQSDTRVSPIMKERIYEALLEEHEKAKAPQAKKVLQRKEVQFH
jgi:hypothetical protein